jgi:hypothetical protein
MHARLFRPLTVVAFAVMAAMAATASAQFGHPLKGTWTGDWGPNKDTRTHVVLELNWDGKAITGAINPGANGVALKIATLDAPNWRVHFEADGKDAAGNAVHYVIDGKMENIGAYQRFITGTWTQGSVKGDFKVTRT